MPRKAKENEELENIEKNKKNSTRKTTNSKTTNSKKAPTKKDTSLASKKEKTSKNSVSTKTTAKATKATKSTKATKNAKDSTTKKKSTSKQAKKTSSSTKKQTKPTITEYYDLPEKYNQTVVKVLAQTPKTLFIYWEISETDIENYKKQYGENFFETTKPVLIIHNDNLNYSFEVEINDFANSWYLHINDSKSNYRIELGRRPISNYSEIKTDYIYITSSNKIESPNDHILFNNSQKMVYFRNVKTNIETQKPISSLSFMRNMGKIYDIYDIYKELYKNEDDFNNLSNPSSHTSSQFK